MLRAEFAFPGPLRDRLVAAVLSGEKTTTTGLLLDYEQGGESLPKPGDRRSVVDSADREVGVIEIVSIDVLRLADVDLAHAMAEGEGHTTVADWRAAHEHFWHSAEMRADLGDPTFTVTDETPVVAERFRLVPGERMRAVVVSEPGSVEALELVEVPVPRPGEGELTIDVEFAGVGFVDTLFRSGALDFPAPFTPGIEVTGRVRELGPGVSGFEVGQPVGASLNDFGRAARVGGYAEVAVAHASMAAPIPEDADRARIAAALVNGVTAWLALNDLARLQPQDDVLVLGASGGLGGTMCRLAAIHPARRVIGVAGRAAVPAECTDVVPPADLGKAVRELTGGRGVDIVIDPVGGRLRREAFESLAPFGRLMVVGDASGQDEPLSGDAAWLGSRQVIGLSVGGVAHLVPGKVSAATRAVIDLVHRGVLDEPAPAFVPLDRVGEVHQALENRTAPPKTVIAL